MQNYKIFTAKEIIVLFFLLQSCKAIEAAHREKPDYRYLWEASESEKAQMLEDRIFERTPTPLKRKGVGDAKQ